MHDSITVAPLRWSGGGRIVSRAIDQRRDIICWHGLVEQIALTLGAAVGLEIGQLSGVLDALGGSRQAKPFCKTEDRANDHLGVVAFIEARHKAAINLDLVQTKRKQLAQRGI